MGIGRTRATKAMKINETFDARADCEQMPVAKAYAMRKRKKTVEYESPLPPDNSCFRPNERVLLANARFQDLETLGYVKPETADLLLGDPPYVGDWLPQIPDLAAFAARVLKPGGLAVLYYGNTHLNVMIREMEKHLQYVATLCHPYEADGLRTVNYLGFEVCWKPIVVFSKGGWKRLAKDRGHAACLRPREGPGLLAAVAGRGGTSRGDVLGGGQLGCRSCGGHVYCNGSLRQREPLLHRLRCRSGHVVARQGTLGGDQTPHV